jgi:predicted permease
MALGSRGVAREVDRELRAHLRLKEEDLMALGLTPDEARVEAARVFGDYDAVAHESGEVRAGAITTTRRREWWSSIVMDTRIAARGLRRAPAFTTVAVLTLALGIGANTAMFSAIDGIVGRSAPYRDADRLLAPSLKANTSVSKQRLERLRERQRSFSAIAAYSRWGYTLTGGGAAEQLQGAAVTADLFDVLGVRPALGRTFVTGEDRSGRSNVVVLGHGLWAQRFGADSAIIGRALQLNGHPYTVIGVMPPDFAFPVAQTRLWTPTVIKPDSVDDYVSGYLLLIARMRPGVTREAATADLRRVIGSLASEDLSGFEKGDDSRVIAPTLREVSSGDVRRTLYLLLGAVAFVLLIACVNVANLLLARSTTRAREFAIRASLGAGRGRLVRQSLTECLMLALTGGAAGLLVAYLAIRAFAASIPTNSPGATTIALDARVLAFSFALSVIVGLVFGLAPALRLSRGDANDALRDGGGSRGATHGVGRHRMMRSLVVSQYALALVLAVGAGLVLQSFWRLRSESPGFRAERVLTFTVTTNSTRHPTEESQATFFANLFARLGAIPGARDVGAIHLLPLGGGNWNLPLGIEGRPLPDGATPREVDWRLVTPEYFRSMSVPLVAGRFFDATDRLGTPTVALVSRSLVERYFPGEDPIGKRVRTFFEGRDNFATIVGVVGDTKDQTLAGDARPQFYRSFWQRPQTWMSVMIRTDGDPLALAGPVRAIVSELDADAPVTNLTPMVDVVSSSIANERLLMWLLAAFGALAIALGTIGIYGVMSYVVQQRTAEIGVRVAMGARPSDIRAMVLGQALRMTAVGLLVGAAAALALSRVLTTQLHDVSARDPLVFASTILLLAVVGVLASWIPARRAARAEPTVLLRTG